MLLIVVSYSGDFLLLDNVVRRAKHFTTGSSPMA